MTEYRTPKFAAKVMEAENGYIVTDETFQPFKDWICSDMEKVILVLEQRMTDHSTLPPCTVDRAIIKATGGEE